MKNIGEQLTKKIEIHAMVYGALDYEIPCYRITTTEQMALMCYLLDKFSIGSTHKIDQYLGVKLELVELVK